MYLLRVLTAVGLLLGATGFAKAGSFTIDIEDLTNSVSVTINGLPATLLPDSNGEFVHFTLPTSQPDNLSGFSASNDLWESPNGPVSDRLLQTGFNNDIDIKFGSGPANLPPLGRFSFPIIVEDGTLQHITDTSIAFGDGHEDNFFFYVRSSPESVSAVPEPTALSIFFIGATWLIGWSMWRKQKSVIRGI